MKTGTRWLDVLSHGAVYLGIGLDLATVMRLTEDEKGLQIMLLRQQPRGLHIPRWQKVPLAVLGKVWINPNRPVGVIYSASTAEFPRQTGIIIPST